MITCDVYLVVNEGGDYGVGDTHESAADNYGKDLNESPVRTIKVTIQVPNIVSEVKGVVPRFEDAVLLVVDDVKGDMNKFTKGL